MAVGVRSGSSMVALAIILCLHRVHEFLCQDIGDCHTFSVFPPVPRSSQLLLALGSSAAKRTFTARAKRAYKALFASRAANSPIFLLNMRGFRCLLE